jgi:hypothetical protein
MTSLESMSFLNAASEFEQQNAESQCKGQGICQDQGPLFNNEAIDKP